MRQIDVTKNFSKKIGKIAKGCRFCVKGEKLVLFATGICPRHCFYCPLSEKKKDKDVIYANEWKINAYKDIIEEARLTDARGAGITGGDPAAKIERTTKLIKMLKKEFGKDFHIHLYTSFELATEKNLSRLYDAGLDEIRFHPVIDDSRLWGRIRDALAFGWDIGIEIPVIPGMIKETKELIDFFEGKVKFLNLNELEVTDTNAEEFLARGLRTRNRITQAIDGSREMGNKLLKYCLDKRIDVHFCTPKLKDAVQMKNRLIRRAKNIATEFDYITDEGLLIRPAVYGDIAKARKFLRENKISFMEQKNKKRLIISPEDMERRHTDIKAEGLRPALVEQYPTKDELDVNIDFL